MSRFTMSILIALGGALVVETVFLVLLVVKRKHLSREAPSTDSDGAAVPSGVGPQRGGEPFLKSIATSVVSGFILFLITAAFTGSFTKPSTPQAPDEIAQRSESSDSSHIDANVATGSEPDIGTLEESANGAGNLITDQDQETQPLNQVTDGPDAAVPVPQAEDPGQAGADDRDVEPASPPSAEDPVAAESPEDSAVSPTLSIETSEATTARLGIPLSVPATDFLPTDVSVSRILVEGTAASATIGLQAGSAPRAEARVQIDAAASTAVISLGDSATFGGEIPPRVLVQEATTTLPLNFQSPEHGAMGVSEPRVRVEGAEATELQNLVAPPPEGD